MFKSIRWRIILPYGLLILVVIIFLGLYNASFVQKTTLNTLKDKLFSNAVLIADAIHPSKQSSNNDDLLAKAVEHWAVMLDMRITVVAPDGLVLADSHEEAEKMVNHLDREEIQAAMIEGQGSSIRFSHTLGYEMLYAAVAMEQGEQVVGFVRLAMPLNEIEEHIDNLQRVWLAVGFIISLISIGLSSLISVQITKPLLALTKSSQSLIVDDGDYDTSLSREKDEISKLTQTFNRMTVSIKQKLDELEKEKGKLSAVLEEMSDGVIITDRQGVIQLINQAAIQMFEPAAQEVIGSTLIEVTRQHQIVALLDNCIKSGLEQALSFEVTQTKKFLHGVATPSGSSLEGLYLLLFQDLTQQRQNELMRQDFVSNVSHELRNPLAVIKLLSETLQDGAMSDEPTAMRFLRQIEGEADNLSRMVNELLELSRAESGNLQLDLLPVRAIELMKQVFDRLQVQAEQAGVALVYSCQDDLPLIKADKTRLEQVLINLVHNAIKFSPSGSSIKMSAMLQDSHILFSVEDQGIGISVEDLPHVFERFYKADRSRSGLGTGLGLAVARQLVEAQGGKIWVESILGQGSTFIFTIPLHNNSLIFP